MNKKLWVLVVLGVFLAVGFFFFPTIRFLIPKVDFVNEVEAAYPWGYVGRRIETGNSQCLSGWSLKEQSSVRCDVLRKRENVKNESGNKRSSDRNALRLSPIQCGVTASREALNGDVRFKLCKRVGDRVLKTGVADGASRKEIHNSSFAK